MVTADVVERCRSAVAIRLLRSRRQRSNWLYGLAFTSPTLLGWAWLLAYPLVAGLYYSFTSYSIIGRYKWIGINNYLRMLSDQNLLVSLGNTAYFVIFSVPLGILCALLLALLLNLKVKGMSLYRTTFYLPTIVPPVASAVIWSWVFNRQYGILNSILALFGINGPGWLSDPVWAKPALIIMSVWGSGNLMVIFLAGLQDVPQELYDAAEVDGANRWQRFRYITYPFLTPQMFFALITGLIGGFQYFTPTYVMTGGGPANATLMYALYLYFNAFQYFKMGYASAMAWVLFIIVVVCTVVVFKTTARYVYYAGK
jgi:multiple sugar transport system permease protein